MKIMMVPNNCKFLIKKKLDGLAPLVTEPSPANSNTDTETHPLSYAQSNQQTHFKRCVSESVVELASDGSATNVTTLSI